MGTDNATIFIPKGVMVISDSESHVRRFATLRAEQQIRELKTGRETRLGLRNVRREHLASQPETDVEIKKWDSIEKMRMFLFLELAKHENASKGLSPDISKEDWERLKRTLDNAKMETAQALWTLT